MVTAAVTTPLVALDPPALEIADLRIGFPAAGGMVAAVRGVSFTVAAGETFCLVGESGCGKSLTALAVLRLLNRRARVSATVLRLNGIDLLAANEQRMSELRGAEVAMVFQEPATALNPVLTIGDQLTEGLIRHRRTRRTEARQRALDLLVQVGVTEPLARYHQYPHQLSGGQRQRVMIAMALMCGSTRLIVADEPTTALDVTVQAQILHLLKAVQRQTGCALLLITHDLGVVARVADRVAVMYAGEIVETAPVADLFATPRHPYTRALLSCLPAIGAGRGQPLGSIPGMVPTAAELGTGCGFADRCVIARPECRSVAPPLIGRPPRQWRCPISDDDRGAEG